MVRATQKGEMENPSPEITKVASTVSKSDVKKMASTKHKGLPEKKEIKEVWGAVAKVALGAAKGAAKQKAKQVVRQKAVNVARGAIPQPNRDQQEAVSLDPSSKGGEVQKTEDQAQKKMNQIKKQVLLKKLQAVRSGGGETVTASYQPEGEMTEGVGRAAIGAGIGAMVGGPVGAAVGGSIGAAMGKKKKVTGGNTVKKKATNFFKAEPKVTSSEGVVAFVKKGLERDKKAKDEKKIKNRKAVPYAALGASYQPEGELVDETYFDTNRRGISTKGGFAKQYNKPGKLSRASLNHERKSKNPELRMSKKELRKSMEDDANYEKKMGRSKPTPSNLKAALKKQSANEELSIVEKMLVKYLPEKKKPSVHDDYYDPMEDPTFDPHEAEATRGQSGRGTKGKMNVRKKYKVKEEVGISSAAAMEKAKKEAKLRAKEEAKVASKKKVTEAKVDTGKSPEEKEKDRNVRRFGVSHNVAGHGKLRRALHRSDRGDKKIKGDKTQWVETEAYRVLAKDKTDLGRPAAFSYKDEKDAKKFADSIKSKGGKATVHKEGVGDNVMKIVNKYRKKQKAAHKYPEGRVYKDPGEAAKRKLKASGQEAVGILPDAADKYPERSSNKK